MQKQKFEIIYTINDRQEQLKVGSTPIQIGFSDQCQIKIEDCGGSHIKAILQNIDGVLSVKSFDDNFLVIINGSKYRSAKIKNSTYIQVGIIDIVVSVVECDLEDDQEDDIIDEYTSEVSLSVGPPTIPDFSLPEELSKNEKISISEKEVSHSNSTATKVEVQKVEEDEFFKFNIEFDEETFKPIFGTKYIDKGYDYSSYVDFKEVAKNALPEEDITEEKTGHCIQISYLNNGIVIDEDVFELKNKRIYASNSISNNKFFKVTDFNHAKSELVFVRDRKIVVVKQDEYDFHRVDEQDIVKEIVSPTATVMRNERIVLTKGTGQIIIKIIETPPHIKHTGLMDIDEELLKITSIAWALVIVPLLLIFLMVDLPRPEDKTKEMVIIYKPLKKPKKVSEVKPVEVVEPKVETEKTKDKVAVKETEKPKADVKRDIPTVTKKEKVVAKEPVKKPRKKKASAARKNKKPVKRTASRKKPTKKYKFGSTGNMAAAVGGGATKLKSATSSKSIDVTKDFSSSSGIVKDFNKKRFNTGNVKVDKFDTGSRRGKRRGLGARNLSSKAGVKTAYIEANTKILGAMDPELIRKIMREYIPQFRYCYQRELIKNPSLAGTFDLEFQINARGKGINVGGGNKSKQFSAQGQNCLKRVVKKIRFPKPKGGGLVDVKQPMNFYKQ